MLARSVTPILIRFPGTGPSSSKLFNSRRFVLTMEDENEATAKCESCADELEYAAYALGVQEGVMGGTGFVATHLHDWLLFCSRKCLAEYMGNGDDVPQQSVRFP